MINCLFCDAHNCEWWGVDRWVESCPCHPDIEDEEEEANRREYEEEQAELIMEEERAIAAVHGREGPYA
jgi:hypothetical protein